MERNLTRRVQRADVDGRRQQKVEVNVTLTAGEVRVRVLAGHGALDAG